jgi:hypothetical protein
MRQPKRKPFRLNPADLEPVGGGVSQIPLSKLPQGTGLPSLDEEISNAWQGVGGGNSSLSGGAQMENLEAGILPNGYREPLDNNERAFYGALRSGQNPTDRLGYHKSGDAYTVSGGQTPQGVGAMGQPANPAMQPLWDIVRSMEQQPNYAAQYAAAGTENPWTKRMSPKTVAANPLTFNQPDPRISGEVDTLMAQGAKDAQNRQHAWQPDISNPGADVAYQNRQAADEAAQQKLLASGWGSTAQGPTHTLGGGMTRDQYVNAQRGFLDAVANGESPAQVGPWRGPMRSEQERLGSGLSSYEMASKGMRVAPGGGLITPQPGEDTGNRAGKFAQHMQSLQDRRQAEFGGLPMEDRRAMITARARGEDMTPAQARFQNTESPSWGQATAAGVPPEQMATSPWGLKAIREKGMDDMIGAALANPALTDVGRQAILDYAQKRRDELNGGPKLSWDANTPTGSFDKGAAVQADKPGTASPLSGQVFAPEASVYAKTNEYVPNDYWKEGMDISAYIKAVTKDFSSLSPEQQKKTKDFVETKWGKKAVADWMEKKRQDPNWFYDRDKADKENNILGLPSRGEPRQFNPYQGGGFY